MNGLHCVLSPLATPIISSHVEMNDVWVAALIGPAIRHPLHVLARQYECLVGGSRVVFFCERGRAWYHRSTSSLPVKCALILISFEVSGCKSRCENCVMQAPIHCHVLGDLGCSAVSETLLSCLSLSLSLSLFTLFSYVHLWSKTRVGKNLRPYADRKRNASCVQVEQCRQIALCILQWSPCARDKIKIGFDTSLE